MNRERLLKLPFFLDDRGGLVAMESNGGVPFTIQRVFSVSAKAGEVRGNHAHKKCSQFMVCVSGAIEVKCNDGIKEYTYQLNSPDCALNVEPGIWAQETYLTDESVLIVLCDRKYEEDDYIHEYEDFLKFKRG